MYSQPQLFEQLFKQPITADNSLLLMEKVTEQYPWFAAAQLYRLSLLPDGDASIPACAQASTLHFYHTGWLNLQYQILRKCLETRLDTTTTFVASETITDIAAPQHIEDHAVQAALADPQPEPKSEFSADTAIIPETITTPTESAEPVMADAALQAQEEKTTIEDVALPTTTAELTTEKPTKNEQMSIPESVLIAEEELNTIAAEIAPEQPTEEDIIAIKDEETATAAVSETLTELAATTETSETAIETAAGEHIAAQAEEMPTNAAIVLGENESNENSNNNQSTYDDMNSSPLPPLKPLEIPAESSTDLLFQPLHTSDYFASVGIKLGEEAKSADRLGRQMKSFTEWLKTMKKIHPETLQTAIAADITDEKVVELAAASNEKNEVFTETMAEVLIQQGKLSRAIAVYEKLSLLNPGKSAFFAAQIQKLKA